MQASEVVPILQRLREQLVDFHQAVARAHERALLRTLEVATRQLRWLAILAHEVTEDSWHGRVASLQEVLSGLPTAAFESWALTVPALAQEAHDYWQGRNFAEAAADLLSRQGSTPEDLQALAQALALFFDELARTTAGTAPAPSTDAGKAGGEQP